MYAAVEWRMPRCTRPSHRHAGRRCNAKAPTPPTCMTRSCHRRWGGRGVLVAWFALLTSLACVRGAQEQEFSDDEQEAAARRRAKLPYASAPRALVACSCSLAVWGSRPKTMGAASTSGTLGLAAAAVDGASQFRARRKPRGARAGPGGREQHEHAGLGGVSAGDPMAARATVAGGHPQLGRGMATSTAPSGFGAAGTPGGMGMPPHPMLLLHSMAAAGMLGMPGAPGMGMPMPGMAMAGGMPGMMPGMGMGMGMGFPAFPAFPGYPGMPGAPGMAGMHGMHGMHGMPGMPGMMMPHVSQAMPLAGMGQAPGTAPATAMTAGMAFSAAPAAAAAGLPMSHAPPPGMPPAFAYGQQLPRGAPQ